MRYFLFRIKTAAVAMTIPITTAAMTRVLVGNGFVTSGEGVGICVGCVVGPDEVVGAGVGIGVVVAAGSAFGLTTFTGFHRLKALE